MDRRITSLVATVALSLMLGGGALADPPVVSTSVQPDQTNPSASASATAPTDTTTPLANVHSSAPIMVSAGTGTDGSTSSSGTTVSGPGTSVSSPIEASRGSDAPSTSSPSTDVPTASHHASTPTDTSGTVIEPSDQTIALRSSGTTAGASVSDPSSANMIAAFCFLAHANEANGTPTADVSSVCGDAPSTAAATAFSDEGGAGSANNGVGGSLCLIGNASATTPATASLGTACGGTSPSTASNGGGTSASDGTTITPAMRASVCANAQASADLSSTAQFVTVCGASPQTDAADNAWTPRDTSALTNGAGSPAEIAAAIIASLPFTGTASAPIFGGGLLLIGAGLAILLRARKTS